MAAIYEVCRGVCEWQSYIPSISGLESSMTQRVVALFVDDAAAQQSVLSPAFSLLADFWPLTHISVTAGQPNNPLLH